MKDKIKAVRIFLLVLIILGLGLLATQAYWVTPLVNAILSHEKPFPAVDVTATSTTATSTKDVPAPKPVPGTGTTSSGVDAVATIGPTCPVMQDPDTGTCADKPYETTLVLATTKIGQNGGVLVKTDANGRFSRDLAPGTYTIRAQSDAKLPRLSPVTFEVKANERTKLTLQFDSGIR